MPSPFPGMDPFLEHPAPVPPLRPEQEEWAKGVLQRTLRGQTSKGA
jgi:hypothetical protein